LPTTDTGAYHQRANPFRTGGDEEEMKLFLPVVRPHWPALPGLTAGIPPLWSVDLS